MSPAYGDFYNKPYMDFLSVRASLVNRNIVEKPMKQVRKFMFGR